MAMRALFGKAIRQSKCYSKSPSVLHRGLRVHQVIYKDYCSAYDAPGSPAEAVQYPPKPPADHRQIAIDQELFFNSPYSPGSPIFLPNGTYIFNTLLQLVRAQYIHFKFQEVITPTIYKKSLWEKSGHWENYADDMYAVKGQGATGETEGREIGENEEYGLKPMNCPGHCLIFASKLRSYRDLPIRYADFSGLHRNEVHGALTGLTRVRRFHQDDGHIFCRPSQIGEEISSTLEFIRMIYTALGLGPYRLALSTRPKENYIGTVEEWDNAERALRQALEASGQEWAVDEGNGAFYGPKIDIVLKDSDGKEHQTATIQLDFQLPRRFELEYQAPAPELEQKGETTEDPELLAKQGPVTPVMIHRAVLGSVERIMALLIEHHNGHWPFWLNPRPGIIITSSDEEEIVEYAKTVQNQLSAINPTSLLKFPNRKESQLPAKVMHKIYRPIKTLDEKPLPLQPPTTGPIDLDTSPRSVGKKIREAKLKRFGAIIVIGKRELDSRNLTVDLSGIPDPYGFVRRSKVVLGAAIDRARSDFCTTRKIPISPLIRDTSRLQRAPDSLTQERRELCEAWMRVKTGAKKKALRLKSSDLHQLVSNTKHLRRLFEGLYRSYL